MFVLFIRNKTGFGAGKKSREIREFSLLTIHCVLFAVGICHSIKCMCAHKRKASTSVFHFSHIFSVWFFFSSFLSTIYLSFFSQLFIPAVCMCMYCSGIYARHIFRVPSCDPNSLSLEMQTNTHRNSSIYTKTSKPMYMSLFNELMCMCVPVHNKRCRRCQATDSKCYCANTVTENKNEHSSE